MQSFRQPQRKFVPSNQGPARQRTAAPSSVFDPALRCLEAGDVAGAVSRLIACRQHVRKSEIASNLLANLLLRLSRPRDAVDWFDAALKLRPGYPEALAARGLALQALDRHGEAVSSYDRALALRPDDPDTLYNRGVALETFPVRHHWPRTAYGLRLRGSLAWTGDTRPIPEALAQCADAGETVAHDCALHGNPSHSGIDDLEREYPRDLLARCLLYHYGSAADGDALAARGYRVARPGDVVALPPSTAPEAAS